jgi:site-specific DNA-cytosine methylase
MRVLSLFDGMSCGQYTLNKLGIPVEKYYASEIDKYAIKIAKKNFPNTIHLGDVKGIDNSTFYSLHQSVLIDDDIDLLLGGSPCQSFSFAGNQLNFDDPRGKLFFEFVRLKDTLNIFQHKIE